jgi:hypothetical protein
MDQTTVCKELQENQKLRNWYTKTRIMNENRLRAAVTAHTGYHDVRADKITEKRRKEMFEEADEIIEKVVAGEMDFPIKEMILITNTCIKAFSVKEKDYKKQMLALVKRLSVADWVEEKEQKGFGLDSLAKVVGECGDLANYSCPGKVCKRMGLVPFTSNGVTHMGSSWKNRYYRDHELESAEWEEFGYSPRRRSVSFIIGENLIKQNGDGPYRTHYNSVKQAAIIKHPDWLNEKGLPGTHIHRHSMLLATKLLFKNMWMEWNPTLVKTQEELREMVGAGSDL